MRQALLVGLPGSGKTTFVAALWHVIASRSVDDALALQVLDAPVEHLNELSARWLSFQEANRTSSDAEEISTIRTEPRDGESTIEIVVPDLAGESIQRSLTERRWPKDFSAFVRGSTGVLLFVHPWKVFPHSAITDAIDIAGEEPLPSSEADTANESAVNDWSSEKVPTQVELVDLLQLLCEHIGNERFRLAVIVSAWDLVVDQGLPSGWVAKELPLLDQFLMSAQSRLDSRVYGVSAQGGRLPEDIECLMAYTKASDRIRVVLGRSEPSHDITAPLQWVLNVDSE